MDALSAARAPPRVHRTACMRHAAPIGVMVCGPTCNDQALAFAPLPHMVCQDRVQCNWVCVRGAILFGIGARHQGLANTDLVSTRSIRVR